MKNNDDVNKLQYEIVFDIPIYNEKRDINEIKSIKDIMKKETIKQCKDLTLKTR